MLLALFGATAGQSGTDDSDTDGLSNQFEYQLTSNPGAADSDGDGLNDGPEYFTHRTKILIADTDGDGLKDGPELFGGSDPLDGVVAATGVVAVAPTPGWAMDVAAGNGLAVVAANFALAAGIILVLSARARKPALVAE